MKATDHILEENLNIYARREADAAEILRIQAHLSACDACRRKLAAVAGAEKSFAALRETFAFDEFSDEPEHLTYEQLEFFLDRKLDDVTREIVESHLAFCGECEKDLQDLIRYREIARESPAVQSETLAAAPKVSFWKRLFAFDSARRFAPVATVLLIAVLFGAWFLLNRGNRTEEIAGVNQNQNAAPANSGAAGNSPLNENSPAPQISPEEIPSKPETLYALSDGNLKIDDQGGVQGAENLSPATRELIRQSVQSGKVSVTNNRLGGSAGVLMGENNSGGVPFALTAPLGKVTRDAQPVLSWKPLKDAQNYSVAVVDENFRVVASSGKVTSTNWKPPQPLPRGANYSWQVTATLPNEAEIVSPASPAPPARFRVVEGNLNDEISRLEKSNPRSHLALGLLYAKAGLKPEARHEFEKLVQENPNSPLARKLLQSVR